MWAPAWWALESLELNEKRKIVRFIGQVDFIYNYGMQVWIPLHPIMIIPMGSSLIDVTVPSLMDDPYLYALSQKPMRGKSS